MYAPTDPRSWGGGAPIWDGGYLASPIVALNNIRILRALNFAGSALLDVAATDTNNRSFFGDLGGNTCVLQGSGFQLGSNNSTVQFNGAAMSMVFTERASPSAPAANTGAVFMQDNGAGKTQLIALFPTGAAQVIATEP